MMQLNVEEVAFMRSNGLGGGCRGDVEARGPPPSCSVDIAPHCGAGEDDLVHIRYFIAEFILQALL